MLQEFKRECPKCYASRTMLATSFALPGYKNIKPNENLECINETCALPVHVLLCPRCHFLEIYHDVGEGG